MSSSGAGAPPLWVAAVQALSRAFGVLATGLILLSVLVICHMVFVRAVLGASSIWQTEFTTFALIAATFLGAPYILLTRGHVCVDVLPLMLSSRHRRWLALAGNLLAFAFCALFLFAALPWWLETWHTGQTTPSIWRAPLWIAYLAVPVGLSLLCLQFLAESWMVWTRRLAPFGLPDAR